MNFKKRVNGSWTDTPHYIHKTDTDTITTPADIYVNDTTATVGLKGQMEQSSTPTPSSPIQPQECGERTGNLFDISAYSSYTTGISNIVITPNSITYTATSVLLAIRYYFPLNTTDIFTIQLGSESSKVRLELRYRKNGSTVGDAIVVTIGNSYVIRGSEDVDEIQINISNGANTGTCTASNIMLNKGSTALPYEPYGYKIPISSAGQTNNIYLGNVQTTRRIKKVVFKGSENWTLVSGTHGFYTQIDGALDKGTAYIISSHYRASADPIDGTIRIANNKREVLLFDNYASAAEYKAFLAQQYSAGTPVTVLYVLATPETAVVNEPLRKIGDYADEVSGITIPTIAGTNTLSVDTTLQPSEVSVNYKGWHPVVNVHEYDSNYTIATMQALTIAQLQTHTITGLQGGGWS